MNIKDLLSKYPKLVKSMADSSHGTQDDPYGNPYHMEGDVWTHTMMVMQEARHLDLSNLQKISLLLHDIGKPKTRQELEGKVRFKGHELLSALMAMDMLSEYSNEDKIKIFKYIWYHTALLANLDKGLPFIKNMFAKDPDLLLDLIPITKADAYGRITAGDHHEMLCHLDDYLMGTINSLIYNEEINNFKGKVNILIGLPASGKSTYLKNKGISSEKIISRDSLAKELFGGEEILKNISDRDKRKLDKTLMEKIKQSISMGEEFYIDMVNLNDRDRYKTLKNIPGNWYKNALVFISPWTTILERNKSRNKNVSEDYILRQVKLSSPPTYADFNNIQWVFNE